MKTKSMIELHFRIQNRILHIEYMRFTILHAEHFFLVHSDPHVLQASSRSSNASPLIYVHMTCNAEGLSPWQNTLLHLRPCLE